MKNILIILGHPARERNSFCETLARTYEAVAKEVGHSVEFIKIADLTFDPILHEGYVGEQHQEPDIADTQQKLLGAEHLVIVYPMWQFMIPALLKGFLERTLTKGFAYNFKKNMPLQKKLINIKSARIIQTMAMPNFIYRLLARQHGAKALKALLSFCGIAPVRTTYCGLSEELSPKNRGHYIKTVTNLGRSGR